MVSQRWPNLAKKLLGDNPEQQVQDILKFADQLKNNPQLQKSFLSEFFGNGDDVEKLMRNGAKGFFDEFRKQQKLLNPLNPDLLKQAQAFRDAQIGFNDALTNFENSAGPAFLKQMRGIVGEATNVVDPFDGKPANPSEPKKLWGDISKGDIGALGKELGHVFANSVRADLACRKGGDPDRDARDVKKSLQNGDIQKWLKHAPPDQQPDSGFFHKSAFITGDCLGARHSWFRGHNRRRHQIGVLAAFRELMATNEANSNTEGGFTQASYETGGFGGSAAVALAAVAAVPASAILIAATLKTAALITSV